VADAGQVPGASPLNKRMIEAVKHMGPVGERAIAVLHGKLRSAMELSHPGCLA
jgi:hypothetical protein